MQPRHGAHQLTGRRDRREAAQLRLQRTGAGPLDGARVHARRVKGAELAVGCLGGGGRGRGEPVGDTVQRLVVALHQLGEAAVARIFGRQQGAGQPAAVCVAVEVLARSARRVEVRGVEAVVDALGWQRRDGAASEGRGEQTGSRGQGKAPPMGVL